MESQVDADVLAAIHSGVVTVRRRLEIFESDGVTPWLDPQDSPRMIGGTVTVDYGRDERRAIDVVLDNQDGRLNHDPSGLYYDKILKVYRGVEYRNLKTTPSILVISDRTEFYPSIISALRKLGYPDITTRAGMGSTLENLYGYDVIVCNSGHSNPTSGESTLLASAYAAGFNILTIGDGTTEAHVPTLISSSVVKDSGVTFDLNKPTFNTPFSYGWTGGSTTASGVGTVATGLTAGALPAATMAYLSTTAYTAIYRESSAGSRWFHMQPPVNESTPWVGLMAQAMNWLYSYADVRSYEFQVGEFCIDIIDQDNFPSQIRLTGRDYTKRLLQSKFEVTVAFTAGTAVDSIVRAVAANAGIRKMMLSAEGVILGAEVAFEAGTERWTAIKKICADNGVEVFFDRQGYLVTRRFLDPTTSPVSIVLKTGLDGGNLAKFSKRSTDARVRNVIVIISENQDDLLSGYVWLGRAANTEPTSPTRVSRIGERHEIIKTSLLRSAEACQELAETRLRIAALEEFELNFSSLVYPWLDVGLIARFEDPRPGVDEPDKYLLSTLSIPMGLGPMTGTGKRVTIVGGGSVPGELISTMDGGGE